MERIETIEQRKARLNAEARACKSIKAVNRMMLYYFLYRNPDGSVDLVNVRRPIDSVKLTKRGAKLAEVIEAFIAQDVLWRANSAA